MASTNKTETLGLNQWVPSDPFQVEDFNADNAKIDAAFATSLKAYCGSYMGNGGSRNTTRSIPLPAEPKFMLLIGNYGDTASNVYTDIDLYCNGRWIWFNSSSTGWSENGASSNIPVINGNLMEITGNHHNVNGREERYFLLA